MKKITVLLCALSALTVAVMSLKENETGDKVSKHYSTSSVSHADKKSDNSETGKVRQLSSDSSEEQLDDNRLTSYEESQLRDWFEKRGAFSERDDYKLLSTKSLREMADRGDEKANLILAMRLQNQLKDKRKETGPASFSEVELRLVRAAATDYSESIVRLVMLNIDMYEQGVDNIKDGRDRLFHAMAWAKVSELRGHPSGMSVMNSHMKVYERIIEKMKQRNFNEAEIAKYEKVVDKEAAFKYGETLYSGLVNERNLNRRPSFDNSTPPKIYYRVAKQIFGVKANN